MCVHVHVYVHAYNTREGALRDQKCASIPLELELWAVVCEPPSMVLGIESGSSSRAVSTPNHQTISLAPTLRVRRVHRASDNGQTICLKLQEGEGWLSLHHDSHGFLRYSSGMSVQTNHRSLLLETEVNFVPFFLQALCQPERKDVNLGIVEEESNPNNGSTVGDSEWEETARWRREREDWLLSFHCAPQQMVQALPWWPHEEFAVAPNSCHFLMLAYPRSPRDLFRLQKLSSPHLLPIPKF